ncbi:MAG TPA: hypothetical protein VGL59_22825 [Polyangia bacterium]|jgi:hypothetical protein
MASAEALWEKLFVDLMKVRAGWPAPEWGYDRRMKCVMSTIEMTQKNLAQAAYAGVLPLVFDSVTLAQAPAAPRALADEYGGVRPGQLLLWGGEPGAPGVFGLWWPWGDGKSVSLRIGLHDIDAPKVRYPSLRDAFGVPQAPPMG